MTPPTVLTIGHSNHSFDAFVALLREHGVSACADVRSAPTSRRHPHFDRERLQAELEARGIAYVFLGRELGGRPSDPACYEQGRVSYRRVAQSEIFESGLARVLRGAERHQIALLCAEREPLDCHRTLLVGRALEAHGAAVAHIHADGRLESQADAMTRLVTQLGLPDPDLFRTREEIVEEACAVQEGRVGYVDRRERL